MTNRLQDALVTLAERDWAKAPGHVYFIRPVDGGLVKIGYTAVRTRIEPARWRLAALQYSSPVQLEVAAVCPAWPQQENMLHRLFAAERQHGEWFTPCDDLLALIDWLDHPKALEQWHEELIDELEGAEDALA